VIERVVGRSGALSDAVFAEHNLNNLVEQDHRAVKRRTRPMMGFKSFWSAARIIAGIETMHMVKKGQLHCPGGQDDSAADSFYSLAAA
jgi:transposase-like protein